jgi:hypothetical protein
MGEPVNERTLVVVSEEWRSARLPGEIVILDLTGGEYFGLTEVGAFVWELIKQRRSVGDVVQAVLETYEVDEKTCRNDVTELLEDLAARGLVTTS